VGLVFINEDLRGTKAERLKLRLIVFFCFVVDVGILFSVGVGL
jgi:hypothetical protein